MILFIKKLFLVYKYEIHLIIMIFIYRIKLIINFKMYIKIFMGRIVRTHKIRSIKKFREKAFESPKEKNHTYRDFFFFFFHYRISSGNLKNVA